MADLPRVAAPATADRAALRALAESIRGAGLVGAAGPAVAAAAVVPAVLSPAVGLADTRAADARVLSGAGAAVAAAAVVPAVEARTGGLADAEADDARVLGAGAGAAGAATSVVPAVLPAARGVAAGPRVADLAWLATAVAAGDAVPGAGAEAAVVAYFVGAADPADPAAAVGSALLLRAEHRGVAAPAQPADSGRAAREAVLPGGPDALILRGFAFLAGVQGVLRARGDADPLNEAEEGLGRVRAEAVLARVVGAGEAVVAGAAVAAATVGAAVEPRARAKANACAVDACVLDPRAGTAGASAAIGTADFVRAVRGAAGPAQAEDIVLAPAISDAGLAGLAEIAEAVAAGAGQELRADHAEVLAAGLRVEAAFVAVAVYPGLAAAALAGEGVLRGQAEARRADQVLVAVSAGSVAAVVAADLAVAVRGAAGVGVVHVVGVQGVDGIGCVRVLRGVEEVRGSPVARVLDVLCVVDGHVAGVRRNQRVREICGRVEEIHQGLAPDHVPRVLRGGGVNRVVDRSGLDVEIHGGVEAAAERDQQGRGEEGQRVGSK